VTIPFTLSDAHAIDDAGVRCVVDGGSPAPCTSYAGTGPGSGSGSGSQTLTGLTTGQHTLTVQAADVVQPGGNHGSATRTFVVDLIPPETTITAGPGDGATVSGPTSFDLSTDDPGARLECRVYPEGAPSPFGSCSGPSASHSIPALAPGRYVFEARAIDPAGNADASPARRTLVVPAPPAPTPAPSPSPTSGPSGGGTAPTPARVVGAAVHYDWLLRGHVTVLLRLTVTGVPQDGAVEARCHGRGCPFGGRRFAVRRGTATLTKAVRSHPLRPGAVFEVRVSEPGAIAKVVRFTIRDHRLPRVDATRG
jgi:hypothetical protein